METMERCQLNEKLTFDLNQPREEIPLLQIVGNNQTIWNKVIWELVVQGIKPLNFCQLDAKIFTIYGIHSSSPCETSVKDS